MELLEKILQRLKNRQKQLDEQISKLIDENRLEAMALVNAQVSEVTQMIWYIEALMENLEG